MAKPRIFISSTFYDLKQVRSDLDNFITGLGYEVIRNEEGKIAYENKESLEAYCYREVSNIDILIAIIGGRFGSESKEDQYSITQHEIKKAIEANKLVYIFIDRYVDAEYSTYLKNKNANITYAQVDDIRVYKFIEEIRDLKKNNTISPFSTSNDIISFLREQWAGLFQRYLSILSKQVEVDTVSQLKEALNTVQQLTTYLKEANSKNDEAVKQILIENHPLFSELRKVMGWKFPIIFHNNSELKELLLPWGYENSNSSNKEGYYMFQNKTHFLYILRSLFNKDGVLVADYDVASKQNLVLLEDVSEELPF